MSTTTNPPEPNAFALKGKMDRRPSFFALMKWSRQLDRRIEEERRLVDEMVVRLKAMKRQ